MTRTLASFGPSIQNAFVPKDFDRALTYWTKTMGVGPFFLMPHVKLENPKYRGQPTAADFDVAIAYWGDTQIELIRQHNDAPSIYKSWRDEGREGLHHTLQLVDDMAAARAAVAAAGGEILQEGGLAGGGEVIYADLGGGPGTMIELLKPGPGGQGFFDMMKAAAKGWDGADPVRRLG
jgi:hypothetical protein